MEWIFQVGRFRRLLADNSHTLGQVFHNWVLVFHMRHTWVLLFHNWVLAFHMRHTWVLLIHMCHTWVLLIRSVERLLWFHSHHRQRLCWHVLPACYRLV